jgi:hypothetical protein
MIFLISFFRLFANSGITSHHIKKLKISPMTDLQYEE